MVNVDKSLCIGCGLCVSVAPDNFDFGDDGLSEVIKDEVTDEVKDAVEGCPTDAISVEEDE